MDEQKMSDDDIRVELERLIEEERERLLISLDEAASEAAEGSEMNLSVGEAKAAEFKNRMTRAKADANVRFDRMLKMVGKS